MEINLHIEIPQLAFDPGDAITGTIRWSVEKPPREVTLSLFWRTSGRGTEDSGVEVTQTWETDALAGKEAFSVQLPPSPYSFTGSLIALTWGLELSTKKGGDVTSLDLIMSPTCSDIELAQIDEG
jgi:hypothetical protein